MARPKALKESAARPSDESAGLHRWLFLTAVISKSANQLQPPFYPPFQIGTSACRLEE